MTKPAVIETARLRLPPLCLEDAPFMLELVNDADFLRYIGDRQVRTLEDARSYLRDGPLMQAPQGLGYRRITRKADGSAVGICGLLRREALGEVDVGYAMLPGFRGQGYAQEAAAAMIEYGRGALGLARIVAIVSADNSASIRVLEKLGLRFERRADAGGGSICLYA